MGWNEVDWVVRDVNLSQKEIKGRRIHLGIFFSLFKIWLK